MEITRKVKKIIFVNTQSEVDKYMALSATERKFSTSDCLFIAMNPTVHSYLKQRGFFVRNTLPYFTNDSHLKVLEKSKILVDWLRKNSDFVDLDMGIKNAFRDPFIFWARLVFHYCIWVIEIVSNAVDIHQPEMLCASLSGKKFTASLQIEPEEKYLGYIVKVIARKKNLEFKNTVIRETSNYNLWISYIKNHVYAAIKFVLKYVRFLLREKMISAENIFVNTKPIFFTTRFYQMDKLAEEIQGQLSDKQLHFLDGPIMPTFRIPNFIVKLFWRRYSKMFFAQQKFFEELEMVIEKEIQLFSFREISFAGIVSKKIKDNIADYILGLIFWAIQFNRFINLSKASAFISNGNRVDDVLLAELSYEKDIPSILISHGSHVPPKNEYENIEWGEHGRMLLRAPFSYLALQSPLAESYLEVFPSASKVVKTGPLIWGRPIKLEESELLFRKMFNEKYDFGKIKVVLHAGTPKRGKGLRPYVYETPDEYIKALNELASAIERISDAILIIKFRPQNEISVADLKTFVPFSEKVILSLNEPFIGVLGMANLFISFSSTAIEEALQNKIPVLLYGGDGRYQHIPAYEIKPNNSIKPSAVYHVKESRDLESTIRKILNLNIDSDKTGYLFEPYVYAQDIRTSLVDLLKTWSNREGIGLSR